ncbi:hypothetical protein HHK36_011447 [Tetracentron sinense]|uniref:Uncharacterized protein n=1 Tax=Tetracentron sinense TaxID=13715 RepID=A0A834ZCQ3_TETSI|nr:hypothetical protein HHK36_011447 [Tetracentron sinense]
MMSRPMVVFFLLLILVFTSQFEWKQQLANELEASPSVSQKQQHISKREEAVKEKVSIQYSSCFTTSVNYVMLFDSLTVLLSWIILSQEKNIQRLNELVRSLRDELLQCRGSNETINGSATPSAENVNELERHHILED